MMIRTFVVCAVVLLIATGSTAAMVTSHSIVTPEVGQSTQPTSLTDQPSNSSEKATGDRGSSNGSPPDEAADSNNPDERGASGDQGNASQTPEPNATEAGQSNGAPPGAHDGSSQLGNRTCLDADLAFGQLVKLFVHEKLSNNRQAPIGGSVSSFVTQWTSMDGSIHDSLGDRHCAVEEPTDSGDDSTGEDSTSSEDPNDTMNDDATSGDGSTNDDATGEDSSSEDSTGDSGDDENTASTSTDESGRDETSTSDGTTTNDGDGTSSQTETNTKTAQESISDADADETDTEPDDVENTTMVVSPSGGSIPPTDPIWPGDEHLDTEAPPGEPYTQPDYNAPTFDAATNMGIPVESASPDENTATHSIIDNSATTTNWLFLLLILAALAGASWKRYGGSPS